MIDSIAKSFTQRMVEQNLVEFDDQDIYYFGMQLLTATVLKGIGIMLIAAALGWIKEAIVFILAFSVLRINAGGVHLDTYLKCFIGTVALMLVTIWMGINIHGNLSIYLISCSLIVSLILVAIYAPVDNPNRRLSKAEVVIYRKRSLYAIITQCLIVVVLVIIKPEFYKYYNIAVISILLEALTLTDAVAKLIYIKVREKEAQ